MKKVIAWILLLCILAFTAAGCTGKSNNNDNGNETTSTPTPVATTEPSPDQTLKTYVPDLKGGSVSVNFSNFGLAKRDSLNPQVWEEGIQDPNFWGYIYNNRDYRYLKTLERVEKDMNGTVVTLEGDSSAVAAMILEGNPPDLWAGARPSFVTLIENGFIQPWDGVKGVDLSTAFDPVLDIPEVDWFNFDLDIDDNYIFSPAIMKLYYYKGKHYALCANSSTQWLIYNTEVYDLYNLETPYELWKKDEWTWEKMLEQASLLTFDQNGDGKLDFYGLKAIKPETALASAQAEIIKYNEATQEYSVDLSDQGFLDTLNLIYETYNKNMSFGGSVSDYTCALEIRNHQWGTFTRPYKLGVAPFPKGPNADNYYSDGDLSTDVPRMSYPIMLPAGAKQPEAAAYIAKAFGVFVEGFSHSMNKPLTIVHTIEGVYDEEQIKIMKEVYLHTINTEVNIPIRHFGIYDGIFEIFLKVREGVPPQTAIEMYKESILESFKQATAKIK